MNFNREPSKIRAAFKFTNSLQIISIKVHNISIYLYTRKEENPKPKQEENTMKKMLEMYGYNTIEEAAHDLGLNIKDAARMIKEMYEEDTAPSPAMAALEAQKAAAKAEYKEAAEKCRKYLNTENWTKYYNDLCKAKRTCRLLGVII